MEKIVYKHTGKMIAALAAALLDHQYGEGNWEYNYTDITEDGTLVYLKGILYRGISVLDLYSIVDAAGIDTDAVSICTWYDKATLCVARWDGSPVCDENGEITSNAYKTLE